MTYKNKENTLYINHKGELLIWLLIVLAIVCGSFFIKEKHRHSDNIHRIFMPDVDGLIVGSPVRMMGIEVGYVTKIKPIKDEVFIKFIIKDKNIKIPQGTHATVEFSGMAGSKSLELYLPQQNDYIDPSTPTLTVDAPKRLHDAFGLLNEMFKRIGNMITASSMFGNKLKTIEVPSTGEKGNLNHFLEYSNEELDKSINRAENFGKRINYERNK